ncbi:hypothetical protein ON010_g18929 [Phytophthora cinnamomi]|nr:hypothetical protein ON010_g18929 [Phytophthora cinnamomi]
MNGQGRNSFPDVAAAHALEAPEGPQVAQQLLVRVTKRRPSPSSINAGMAAVPRVEMNIGDRRVPTSPPAGDREFFLDEFDPENDNKQEKSDAKVGVVGKSSSGNSSRVGTVKSVPDHTTARAWASDGLVKLSATGGEGGSLSVKVSMSKKRPLPVVGVEEEQAGEEAWSRAEFMTGTRSASQQAAIELGVQMAWGIKFAAGRVHSMISF